MKRLRTFLLISLQSARDGSACYLWPCIARSFSGCAAIHVVSFRFIGDAMFYSRSVGGSVAEWLAWLDSVAEGPIGSNRSHDSLLGNSLRQTVHTHCASVHQAAKLVAALLRVAGGNCRPGGK